MAREPNDKVTISYRIPESLRARIAEKAERDGLNITQEITKCVEWYLSESTNTGIDSSVVRMQAQVLRQCEQITGKRWFEDRDTAIKCRKLMIGVIDLLLPDSENLLAAVSPSKDSMLNQLDAADIALQDNKIKVEEGRHILRRIKALHALINDKYVFEGVADSERKT